jgi:hypothetical protein
MHKTTYSIPRGLLLATILSWAPLATATAEMPDTISPPKGGNYGSTSFFDGFGRTTEGFTLLQYGRYESLNEINDSQGNPSPLFDGTHISVYVSLTQLSYASDWHPFGGDAVGFSAALPLIDAQSSFAATSPVKLSTNGFGVGDLVWGPIYQSKMYMRDGAAYFGWRAQLIISSPTGGVNEAHGINQGSGYWAVNPYVTFTFLPVPKLEISNRINYQYNLQGSQFSSPPPIPGLKYVNGQAGQIVYDNFDASYAIARAYFLGVNGFFVHQLNLDKTNGQAVADSLVKSLYLGPGGRIVFPNKDSLNLNVYLKLISENDTSGVKLSFQYVHRF